MGREGHRAKLTLQGLLGWEKAESVWAFLPAARRGAVRPAWAGRREAAAVRAGADSAVQDLHEGLAELDVEGGVDDGVHGTVDIAQPCEGAVEDWRDVAVTVYVQDVRDEEGQPADDEHTQDNGKHLSGFLLLLLGELPAAHRLQGGPSFAVGHGLDLKELGNPGVDNLGMPILLWFGRTVRVAVEAMMGWIGES